MSTFVFSGNKTILGRITDIIVDKKLGLRNIRRNNRSYFISLGYFEKEPSDNKHTVYIIGDSIAKERFKGKVISILKRKDDGELLFVASEIKNEYFGPEIKECLSFFEKKHESDYEFLMEEICQMIMFKYVNGEKKFLLIENTLNGKAGFPGGEISFEENECDTALSAVKKLTGMSGDVFDKFRTEYKYCSESGKLKKTVSFLSEFKESLRTRSINDIDKCFSLSFTEAVKRLDDPQDIIALMEAMDFYEQKAKG